MGLRRDYKLLADMSDGMYYVEQTLPAHAAKGRRGGGAGAPGGVLVRRAGAAAAERLPGKGYIDLHRGDVITLIGSGGGGYDPPEES
jgi:N-methylhydantoinase B/oxoprolinase/acetone carboxylase alpha subunit